MFPKQIDWLLEGDPAIRWQVYNDLLEDKIAAENERLKITTSGWGKKLLDLQDKVGTWAKGIYSPKWTSTTYTMLLLQSLGLQRNHPAAHKACGILLEKGFNYDGGINYFKSFDYSETCVTGMILFLLSYFRFEDQRVHMLADHLLQKQMPDGGWNCLLPRGAKHGSFHTTIIVLEAFVEYERAYPNNSGSYFIARIKANEFLLQHRLFKSHRTGKLIKPAFTRLSFPPRWHYDILRALDYFQNSKTVYDNRMSDAIALILKKRNDDGSWNLQQKYPGRTYFEMETVGLPSRWNTLRCLRVLKAFPL